MAISDAVKYVYAIREIYGKSLSELERNVPEGYEFTGEFRDPKFGEYVLLTGLNRACKVDFDWLTPDPRLILRKKEEVSADVISECAELLANQAAKSIRAAWDKQVTPPTYTAAEVKEKFGESVMAVFGYKHLEDYPGFAFTGRIERPTMGQWYVTNHHGFRPVQSTIPFRSTSHLTLIKLPDTTPRIITFTKMAAADFLEEEAAYLPAANGELIAVNRNEVDEEFFYERREVA